MLLLSDSLTYSVRSWPYDGSQPIEIWTYLWRVYVVGMLLLSDSPTLSVPSKAYDGSQPI